MLDNPHIRNFRCFEDSKACGFELVNLMGGNTCLLKETEARMLLFGFELVRISQNWKGCGVFIKRWPKLLPLLAFLLSSMFSYSQQNVRVLYEKTDIGYDLIVDNDEVIEVSLTFQFILTNIVSSLAEDEVAVVPAKTFSHKVATLLVIQPYLLNKFSYKYQCYYGNTNLTEFDSTYMYDLPYKKGNVFKVYQGYFGGFSHQNDYAVDFTMPIGTEIVAAREGIVVEVVEKNNRGCADESCVAFNNWVTVFHNDGTYAKYVHLDFKGANVKVGQRVNKGDLIGLSGNTGFSSGPHLHFEVNLPSIRCKNTLPTLFRIGDGSTAEFLQENHFYAKNY